MESAVIIQARTDSSRFPQKVLKKLNSKPVLWHVIERSKEIGIPVIVSTTNRPIDHSILDIAKTCNVETFCGSTDDVLDRFYQTAVKFSLKNIIRVTADNPLIDPNIGKEILKIIDSSDVDYAVIDKNFPIGLGMEGFNFETLEKTWKLATNQDEREHVTKYMQNSSLFNVKTIHSPKKYSHYRFTIDTLEDFHFMQKLFSTFSDNTKYYTNELVQILTKHPDFR